MAKTEIRISGYGGQGVILAAYILGKAVAVVEGRQATLNQAFGPEARGSACSAQVVLNDTRVLYPYVTRPHIMIAMSRDGYQKHKDNFAADGTLVYDEDLVQPDPGQIGVKTFGVPATRIAEKLGRKIVSNIVMLGFFGAVTGILAQDALRKAVESSVPEGTQELNLKAFDAGWERGEKRADTQGQAQDTKVGRAQAAVGTAQGG